MSCKLVFPDKTMKLEDSVKSADRSREQEDEMTGRSVRSVAATSAGGRTTLTAS